MIDSVRFWLYVLALVILLVAPPAFGQEAEAPKAKPAAVITDPVARNIVATNPTTPSNIMQLLSVLIDLHQAKAGETLLQKLLDANLDDEQLVALFNEFGSGPFLKLAEAKQLGKPAADFAAKVVVAVDKQAKDPAHIAKQIEQLQSLVAATRATAVNQLRQGREVAVVALLAVLADSARAAEHAHVADALVALGGESLGPLAAALDSADLPLELRVVDVLARIDRPEADNLLLAPALDKAAPKELREAASGALREKSIALPSSDEAAARLYTIAKAYYAQPPAMPTDVDGLTMVWRWDAAGKQPVAEKLTPRVAAFDLAAQWAHRAAPLLPGEIRIRHLYLGALIDGAVYRAGFGKPLPNEPGTPYRLVAELGVDGVENLLADAMAGGHPITATVAAQVLGELGNAELLRNRAPRPSVLTEALLQADPRLRYAALAAIIRFHPQLAFPGASCVTEALKFFINTTGTRRALVGDTRLEPARQQAALLAAVGYDARIAIGEQELLKEAASSADYELVLVDMALVGPPGSRAVRSLRRDGRTAALPIGLLTSTYDYNRAGMIARGLPRTAAFARPNDVAGMKFVVEQLSPLIAPDQIPAEERLAQGRQALDWLAGLAAEPRSWYDFRELEPALASAAWLPALSEPAITVLWRLGTPSSQRTLVELASAATAPLETQQAAASAFAKSVAANGTLLTTTEIRSQYDRYNASEHLDKQVQAVRASLLDSIEKEAAKRGGRPVAAAR